jgi:uncharacterized protein
MNYPNWIEPTLNINLAALFVPALSTVMPQHSYTIENKLEMLGRIEPILHSEPQAPVYLNPEMLDSSKTALLKESTQVPTPITTLFTQDKQLAELTATSVVDYLLEHRDFFHTHAYVLKRLELPHVVGANTISLQAKQVNVLKQTLSDNVSRLEQLLSHAKANEDIAQRLHQITLCLLAQRSVAAITDAAQEAIAHVFGLQDTAIRVWGTENLYHDLPCNQPVSEDIKTFADGLKQPYCGAYAPFSATEWLSRPVASLGIIALRVTPNAKAFGLFVIGSQDKEHFSVNKGTDFLVQLGQIFSASLGRMLPPYS